MEKFIELLIEPFASLAEKVLSFLPNLIAALIITGAGLLIAWVSKRLLLKLAEVSGFDRWCDRLGFTSVIRKAGLWRRPSDMFAHASYWFIVLVFIMVGLSALNLQVIDRLSEQFFMYLPRAFSALVILVFGYLAAGFVSRAVLITAVNGGYNYAKLLAEAVRLLLFILILAMSLEQLQVAPGIVIAAFSIIFGGIVVALSISFGVGGIDAARRLIEKESREREENIEHL